MALLAAQTFVLVLLSVLVAGLLRSHAEILRRAGLARSLGSSLSARENVPPLRPENTPAHTIEGTTLRGEPVHIAVGSQGASTLLAFLSSGCASCEEFWKSLQPDIRGEIPGQARLVVVTRDYNQESPTKLRRLAPPDVMVVMSSTAWEAYDIPQYPYFIYVDGPTGEIHGEGTAQNWEQVVSLLTDALADAADATNTTAMATSNGGERPRTQRSRWAREDDELHAAGIGPGHPSLYAPLMDQDEAEG